jgi:hypothetical protein
MHQTNSDAPGGLASRARTKILLSYPTLACARIPFFRENAIDADLLHDLTEDHLREMGLPLGARLKLRKAISALVSGAEPIGPALAVAPSRPPADTAERRQVTVMLLATVRARSEPEPSGSLVTS